MTFTERLAAFLRHRDEDGASAVEYGLLAAAIAAVIVAVSFAIGSVVNEAFSDTCSGVHSNAANITADCS